MNDSLVNTTSMLDTTKQPVKDYSTLELNPAANKNITVAGPLADVFAMALNQAYAKKTEDLEDQNADIALNEDRELNQEHQGEPNSERNNDSGYGMLVSAGGTITGLESYTAGPIPLTNEIANGGQTKPAYIYTTTAQDVKSETIEEIEDKVKEKSDAFTLVIDDSTPSFDNKEHVEALESLVLQNGGKVYRGYFASYAACESIEFGGNMVKKVLKYTDEDAKNLVRLFGDKAKGLKGLNDVIKTRAKNLDSYISLASIYEYALERKEKGATDTPTLFKNLTEDWGGEDYLGLDILDYNQSKRTFRANVSLEEVELYTHAGCYESTFAFKAGTDGNGNLKFGGFKAKMNIPSDSNVSEVNIVFGALDFVKTLKSNVQSLLKALEAQKSELKKVDFVKAFGDNKELVPYLSEMDKACTMQLKSLDEQIGLIKHLFKDIL